MDTKDWIFFALALLILVGAYSWHRRRLIAMGVAWKKLAKRLGGSFESQGKGWIQEPHYKVQCTYQGRELCLDYYITTSGRSSTYWTRASLDCPEDLEFRIYEESIFQKIGKQVGFQDIHTEHEAYDRAFMIKGRDEGAVKALLTPDLRRRHLELPQAALSASDGRLRAVLRGVVSDEKKSLALMELCVLAEKGATDRGA